MQRERERERKMAGKFHRTARAWSPVSLALVGPSGLCSYHKVPHSEAAGYLEGHTTPGAGPTRKGGDGVGAFPEPAA